MTTRRTALKGMGAWRSAPPDCNFDFTRAYAQAGVKRGGTLNFAISAEAPHYDPHASDTYATLHFAGPFYSTLLRFNLSKFPEVEGDLAQSWTVAKDLMTYTFKLHPNVKFADGTTLTSADIKATYDRLRNPPQGVVSTRKATFSDIGEIETPDPLTVIFKMKAVNAAMLEHFASPWNVIYAAKDLAADPAGAAHQDQRHRAVHLRRARQGQPRLRQEERQLLQEGPALSRRLEGHLHAAGRRDAQRGAGRPGARRVPRHLAGRARPPGAGDGRQDPHRGIELDAQSAGLLQRREEAVRRRAGAQGAAAGDRPLGRQPGPVEDFDAALGRRRGASGLAVRDAGGRAGQAARLRQGHQEVARGSARAAQGGGPGEPQVRAVEPQSRHALHAGRHLPGRPVAADRRHRRAQAVRHRRLSRAP